MNRHKSVPPITGIRPPLSFLAPNLQGWMVRIAPPIGAIYTRFMRHIRATSVSDAPVLIEALRDYYAGKHRLILAFRHHTHADGPLLFKFITYNVPRLASAAGTPLPVRPHIHIMYDRGFVLWAGKWLEWVLPGIGATPILRGKADRAGIQSARNIIASGAHPLAVSPEGGTNNLNYKVGSLQPGLVQLAQWAQDDMPTPLPVTILPIGIHYTYGRDAWRKIDAALTDLETAFGVAPAPTMTETDVYRVESVDDPDLRARYARYLAVHAALRACLAGHWQENYSATLPPNLNADAQVQHLAEVAFTVAETRLGVATQKLTTDRIYAAEQAIWKRRFRPMPAVSAQRGLADWGARDAASMERLMRLASSLHRISLAYLFTDPSLERLADTLILTWDVMAKCLNVQGMLTLGERAAHITIGSPVTLQPTPDRAARKAQFARIQNTLEAELVRMAEGSISLEFAVPANATKPVAAQTH